MPEKKKKLTKLVDMYVKELSFTGKPMTGDEFLFYKSEDGGIDDMSDESVDNGQKSLEELASEEILKIGDVSKEAKTAVRKALRTLKLFEKEIPAYLLNGLMSVSTGNVSKSFDVEDLEKYDLPEELAALIVSQSKTIEGLTKSLEESEKDSEEKRIAEIKKSCDDFAKSVPFIPGESEELSSLLYKASSEAGSEVIDEIKDVLKKANEALEEANSKPSGGGSPAEGNNEGALFVEKVREAYKSDGSIEKSKDRKIADAIKSVTRANPELYNAYNEAYRKGDVSEITVRTI